MTVYAVTNLHLKASSVSLPAFLDSHVVHHIMTFDLKEKLVVLVWLFYLSVGKSLFRGINVL